MASHKRDPSDFLPSPQPLGVKAFNVDYVAWECMCVYVCAIQLHTHALPSYILAAE